MMTSCPVVECRNQKPRRFFMCRSCWEKLPGNLRHPSELRRMVRLPARAEYTLRAQPDKTWVEKAIGYVGKIKIPYVLGHGHSAVKIAADRSEV